MSEISEAKKLVLVSATFTSTTGPRWKVLERMSYIHYLIQFKKDKYEVQALIDSKSEVNAIAPTYTKKLDLQMQKTNVRAESIEGSTLETYGIVIASFQIQNKFGNTRFFQ